MKNQSPSREAIAERAYSFWERAGRPVGRDEEFWMRAEAELTVPVSASSVSPALLPASPAPPQTLTALPVHQIPPAITDAVKTPGRHPSRARGTKRV